MNNIIILKELKNKNNTINKSLAIGLCVIVIGLYNLLFFNKYFPLSEGWFSVFAVRMIDGAVPYRDFHFFLPPLYPLILEIFIRLFGPDFIYLRLFGISVILSMTTILFLLFSRLFPLYIASFVTIISIVYYQSNVAHITYDFLHMLTTFALLGTYLICKYFESENTSSQTVNSARSTQSTKYLFFAGVLGALAFLTKQSNGFLVLVFLFVSIIVCSYAFYEKKGFRYILKNSAAYSIGFLLPLSIVLLWLFSEGAVPAFIDQVFKGASQSKGSLGAILFAWIPRLFTLDYIKGLIIIMLALGVLRYRTFLINKLGDIESRKHPFSQEQNILLFWVIFVVSLLAILLPFWNVDLSNKIHGNYRLNWYYHQALIITTAMTSFGLFFIYLMKIVKEKSNIYFDVFIILSMSVGLILGTATSAAIGDAGLILAIGIMSGYLLFVRSFFNIGNILIFVFCVFFLLFLSSMKYEQPYYWWSVSQPDIRTATEPVNVRYLKGFFLSTETAKIYSKVTAIVEKYTEPADSIYTFPNSPLFYMLTNRYPDTFALVNWFDVLPDNVAEADARHLLTFPPKIIIWLEMPDLVWQAHEKAFRGGQKSGQRMIAAAVEKLTLDNDKYTLEAKYYVPEGCSLKIWRRLGP